MSHMPDTTTANVSLSLQSDPTHEQQHHIILQKCLGWIGMFCCWLAVLADQLAYSESFSESRELLSCHCSLAGCRRGLGRHQTGNTQQVEAMDVYLMPFIKLPKSREVWTKLEKQGCPNSQTWDVNKLLWIRSAFSTRELAPLILSP